MSSSDVDNVIELVGQCFYYPISWLQGIFDALPGMYARYIAIFVVTLVVGMILLPLRGGSSMGFMPIRGSARSKGQNSSGNSGGKK